MKLTDLIQELTAADIRLWLEQDQLRFSAPAGAMSAQRREMIVANKGALIQFLSKVDQIHISTGTASVQHQLSYAQERLWSAEKLHGPSAMYNEGHALCIHGDLDIDVLAQALNFVINRHDILRGYLTEESASPQLAIESGISVKLNVIDYSRYDVSEKERQEHALRYLSNESQKAFNLTQAPLFRFPLIRIADGHHALGVFIHHILCDGLSARVFFRELSIAYESYMQGNEPNLAPLQLQYTDYSRWQRSHLDQLSVQRDVAYWRRKLSALPKLELGDKIGLQAETEGDMHQFNVPGELMRRLDMLAKRFDVSRFALFTSIYQILLSAVSGQNDVYFTTPATEREQNKLQDLIGLFVNSIALRQNVQNIKSFGEFVKHTKVHVNAAFSHKMAPFEKVKEVLSSDELTRREVNELLNNARFVYSESTPKKLRFHDLQVEPFTVQRNVAKFDLMLTMERDGAEDGADCHCNFEYKIGRFSAGYIAALSECFMQVLEDVATKPYRSVGELKQAVNAKIEHWKGQQKVRCLEQKRESLRLIPRRAAG